MASFPVKYQCYFSFVLIYSLVGYAKIFKSANIFLILKFCLQLWKPPFHYCKRSFEVLHERWKFHLYLHNFKLIFKILRLLQISKKLDRIKCLMSWTATSQKEIPNAQYTYEKMPNFFFFPGQSTINGSTRARGFDVNALLTSSLMINQKKSRSQCWQQGQIMVQEYGLRKVIIMFIECSIVTPGLIHRHNKKRCLFLSYKVKPFSQFFF